jgi:hypothetical protein
MSLVGEWVVHCAILEYGIIFIELQTRRGLSVHIHLNDNQSITSEDKPGNVPGL